MLSQTLCSSFQNRDPFTTNRQPPVLNSLRVLGSERGHVLLTWVVVTSIVGIIIILREGLVTVDADEGVGASHVFSLGRRRHWGMRLCLNLNLTDDPFIVAPYLVECFKHLSVRRVIILQREEHGSQRLDRCCEYGLANIFRF